MLVAISNKCFSLTCSFLKGGGGGLGPHDPDIVFPGAQSLRAASPLLNIRAAGFFCTED